MLKAGGQIESNPTPRPLSKKQNILTTIILSV